MTDQFVLPEGSFSRSDDMIKLSIHAVGGQGGGVLTSWIVALAEANGYHAQSTSVPGLAQRTGTTIYYVEMLPQTAAEPVLALMPAPGDVDVVIASEMMEAGRAVERGFVTKERTTLITSTHRVFATSEKIIPGDGRANRDQVLDLTRQAAKRSVAFDMHDMAKRAKSHVSASLFGALAGSGALPFSLDSYVAVIEASGRGVTASLAAFHAARAAAAEGAGDSIQAAPAKRLTVTGPSARRRRWDALVARVDALPPPVAAMAGAGLRKVVNFQNEALGADYLAAVEHALEMDKGAGGAAKGYAYSETFSKYLANALCYDDLIRVADLKTRAARFARVRDHADPANGAVLRTTEYMHPRAEEVVGLFPVGLGRRIEAAPRLFAWIDRRVNKGRRYRSDGLWAFLALYVLGGLKPIRRFTLRDQQERAHRDAWLARASSALRQDYDLAVEILACQRLIKGYSDTHARGQSKFALVLEGARKLEGRMDAADWVRRMRVAALSDPSDGPLRDTLKTIDSFL
ncbi:indolepyruvate ferredoxin oxidoreductase beta subunit [Maritimibacter alkaliphilus HTCC2654]|uniref:Indolepyruvate ferredoxin oxidoreductase n=1 Tax=Maritimibacter alkaliphilus HTCC2654 TaxID=314271 RepID=A3VLQ9_9RHOB|nr:indolepyruvate oxidoreductase subunit beta family protein [Maritimibacter alkaliphilus]EAQ10836.1 indolepyruvate ferredoxin oxidoreductase [Rhodobacterales bacterium HTCC2654] [Maritimibacter alkaliphilus HTCC2654]TYP80511.1 indolepyruvate ferredoxin oxidoreductase beta subunit [Maritimibacter alkaliphilus HTCC2654]